MTTIPISQTKAIALASALLNNVNAHLNKLPPPPTPEKIAEYAEGARKKHDRPEFKEAMEAFKTEELRKSLTNVRDGAEAYLKFFQAAESQLGEPTVSISMADYRFLTEFDAPEDANLVDHVEVPDNVVPFRQ